MTAWSRRAARTTEVALRAAKFAAVGGSGFVLDIACYVALQWIGLDHRIARTVAFWPAVTWNWYWNRRLTFAERPRGPRSPQWARFVAGSLAGLVLNAGGYAMLTSFVAFFDEHRWLALLIGIALGGIANFTLATRYVFGERGAASDMLRVDGP